jgi:hypothetical protein
MGGLQVQGLRVGAVTDYDYRKSEVEIALDLSLSVGDRIHIVGFSTDYIQLVQGMRNKDGRLDTGRAGQRVWMQVKYHVQIGDAVVLLPPREGEEDGQPPDGLGLWGRRMG